jgi:hypothetical protein
MSAATEMSDVVQSHQASLRVLRGIREDVSDLVETLCRRHFVVTDDWTPGPTNATAAITHAAAKATTIGAGSNPLELQFGTKTLRFAASRRRVAVAGRFGKAVHKFVNYFLNFMERPLEIRAMEVIQWPIPTACRFRFFDIEFTPEYGHSTKMSCNETDEFRQSFRQTDTTLTLHGRQ